MPYINIKITKGATQAQKNELIRRFTEIMVDVLEKRPEHTHIVIDEIAPENWGFDGVNTVEYQWRSMSQGHKK